MAFGAGGGVSFEMIIHISNMEIFAIKFEDVISFWKVRTDMIRITHPSKTFDLLFIELFFIYK